MLRMILRRAARFGRRLGLTGPFLGEIAQAVIEMFGDHYDELVRRREFILNVIRQEEDRFQRTLDIGLALLDEVMVTLRERGEIVVPGEEAFRLYDTFGFPIDLTRDVAAEHGLTVDEAGFRQALDEQRARARAAQQFALTDAEDLEMYVDILDELRDEGRIGICLIYTSDAADE